jgi:hypothetical protein
MDRALVNAVPCQRWLQPTTLAHQPVFTRLAHEGRLAACRLPPTPRPTCE